jgi:hypothetical protein
MRLARYASSYGFGDIPVAEARAFMATHPDLYIGEEDNVWLSAPCRDLLTGSLTTPGFATSAHPLWSALLPLEQPKAKILQEQSI